MQNKSLHWISFSLRSKDSSKLHVELNHYAEKTLLMRNGFAKLKA